MPNLKDHRQIGAELDLYSFHDTAPGAVFWHHKGYLIYRSLQDYLRSELLSNGYDEVFTPVMVKSDLFKKSGHWDFYSENIFKLEQEKEIYALKPMNCPEACLIYGSKVRSYQELPIRLADFGILHRNELSGVLGGLFRVRQFTIDDAHHFVRPDQIQKEIEDLLVFVEKFYKLFGFRSEFMLATKPDKAMGDSKLWEEAEKDLEQALKAAKVKYGIKEKDGAFYGPKIDIHIKDSQERDWQLATIQLDFQIPEKMELEYIGKDGRPKRPVIIHRAITGSLERFMGILVEHYQGGFPLWLSPVQVAILPITDEQLGYAKVVKEKLEAENIRAEVDERSERLQAKIRDAALQKIPYLAIIGKSEFESKSVSIRTREGKDLGKLELTKFIQKIKEEIDKKV
ncbi:MAG: threonine--tRNA ligase [Candidatus Levybacteria bacterium RIFCSPHIGHO2_01_FULL_37_17]|nr:MAG: threonine--tRNA ligase [Candidatus Levybacteria bacterium RIFCSPHIGHO2_01_FULL_37_17]OGH36770.1 MAG: threonine--tRNA ligase [Candidatus Levybacteria bacterium RIFCSPLOWO2_01_FULL_38_23]